MRIRLHAASFLVLTGCATTAPVLPDVVQPTITTSQVVVTRSCVTEIPKAPLWATEVAGANADEFTRAKALLVERQQRRLYVPQLEALLKGCQ